jgi:hypothetical protein
MRALEAKANPPSPAAQAIAPFFKGGWKDAALFPLVEEDAALFPLVEEDAALFPLVEEDAALFPLVEEDAAHFPLVEEDTALFPLAEKACRTGAGLITRIVGGKDAELLTPFEKGGRHRAAMTGGFALRAPLANNAT